MQYNIIGLDFLLINLCGLKAHLSFYVPVTHMFGYLTFMNMYNLLYSPSSQGYTHTTD